VVHRVGAMCCQRFQAFEYLLFVDVEISGDLGDGR
jgi:hypothetical protein